MFFSGIHDSSNLSPFGTKEAVFWTVINKAKKDHWILTVFRFKRKMYRIAPYSKGLKKVVLWAKMAH